MLPLTLLGSDTVTIAAKDRRDREQTYSVLRMRNAIGVFNCGMPKLRFDLGRTLDDLETLAFEGQIVTKFQIGESVWKENRQALDPRASVLSAFHATDQIAAALSVPREQIAEWLFRISAGVAFGFIEFEKEFELSPGKKFKISHPVSTMGSVKTPLPLPHGQYNLSNLTAMITNSRTGKSRTIDFSIAAMLAYYGIPNPPRHAEDDEWEVPQNPISLEELAELFE